MPFSTYAELKSALASWNTNRTDLPDADCITLAEARLQRDLQIRTGEVDSALTGVVDSRYTPLPTGFLEPIALFINISGSGRTELRFLPAGMETSDASGQPQAWTVDGTNIALERPCDQEYSFTLRMVEAFTPLSDSHTSNWLLANHPDLYLAAGNLEAALWLQDDEQAVRWQARYGDALQSVNNQAHRSKANATMSVDPALWPSVMGRRGGGYDIRRDG